MVAMIRTARGRIVNPRAGLDEVKAAMTPGSKVAAVVGIGAGRLVQGRVLGIEGELAQIDTTDEPVDARDVIAVVINEESQNG